MVEHPQDKARGLKFEWKPNKKFVGFRWINKLRLPDPLPGKKAEHNDIWHTWCNFQQGNNRIYSRLDRFYYNKDWICVKRDGSGCSVKVVPYTLFDHNPINATFLLKAAPPLPPIMKEYFALNTRLLDNEDVVCASYIIRQFNFGNLRLNGAMDRWSRNIQS